MTGFENLTRRDLRLINSTLMDRVQRQSRKILSGELRDPDDERKYRNSINTMKRILKNVQDAMPLCDKERKKSDFHRIPKDDLNGLVIQLRAAREYAEYMAKSGGLTENEANQYRRKVHQINAVMIPAKDELARKAKNAERRTRIGETGFASDGKTRLTIVSWRNRNNITIEDETGRRIEMQTYKKFKSGKILSHADYEKRRRGQNVEKEK